MIRLSFGGADFTENLHRNAMTQLRAVERRAAVVGEDDGAPERFAWLIRTLRERAGHCDADIRFTLLTGVSRFSKVSLFSGANHLIDITLDPRYSAICGYTKADLDAVFAPELPGLDRDEIRDWYDGYSWRGDERVYNPYDVLLLFDTREFDAYWFETGTPAFLVETLAKHGVGALDPVDTLRSDALASSFDADRIVPEALAFRTGYLTVRGVERRGGSRRYRLGYPNREVRQSLNASLLDHLTGDPSRREDHSDRLYDLLEANDIAGLETRFSAILAGIPYQWYTKNDIADYEGYYASVFYSCFQTLAPDVRVEDASSRGEPIHRIGMKFSKQTRNVVAFDAELA